MAILYDNEGNQINMSEVKSNASDISDLKSRMTTTEGDIDSVEGDITSLDGRLDTAEPKITTLETTSTALVNNKEILGAKNMVKPWIVDGTVIYGITYNVDSDGVVTCNGTASRNSQYVSDTFLIPEGTYKINGCPSGGAENTYFLRVLLFNDSDVVIASGTDTGDGDTFEVTSSVAYMKIFTAIQNGYVVTNLTFKPMIRLATDNNPTFEPYAMSNQELTAKVLDLITRVTALET